MRSSLKCVVQAQPELTVTYTMPTSDTPAVFKNTSAPVPYLCLAILHTILVRMWPSEVPTACYQEKARNVFSCIYRLSSTVVDCGSNVARALSDGKYTRAPLAHVRPFITGHVNNTVLCILLSRSNDEWTCIYARGISTISGTDRAHGRKQVVKSSELNVDARKESKLPLNQNHLSCLFQVECQT